jgi:hypothetical protein
VARVGGAACWQLVSSAGQHSWREACLPLGARFAGGARRAPSREMAC